MLPPLEERSVSRPSVSDFVWTGETKTGEFRVGCLPGIAPGRVQCGAVVIEGPRIKRLSFGIEVVGPEFVPRVLGGGRSGEVKLANIMEEGNANVAEGTLAMSLGPGPSTYTSINHAVELELQAGSLAEEVPFPVKVTPSLKFVECPTEGFGR